MTGSDLVAALEPIAGALEALGVSYFISGSLASAVHKVDVFVSKGRPFDDAALSRAHPESLEESAMARAFPVASAEDIVLAKLEWFRTGGETSERQWGDVIGVLRAGGPRMELEYLRWSARRLGVADLLERALTDAGA